MFDKLNESHRNLAEIVRLLEIGLAQRFVDEWIPVNGYVVHIDDVLETLRGHLAHIERTCAAFVSWAEENRSLNDEIHSEILPLINGIQQFLTEEYGADSAILREFGLKVLS